MNNKIMQINLTDTNYDAYKNLELIESIKEFIIERQLYDAGIKEVRTKLEILDEEFQAKYSHNPIHHIEYRLKSPKSIVDKMQKKGLPLTISSIRENLNDIAGVRVICNYIDDVYRIADLLIRQDDITLIEKEDYISCPKENGYRSLHIIVEIPIFLAEGTEPVRVEIQIRTIAMDLWASLEHQLKYKSQDKLSENLHERLHSCAESIAKIDDEMQSIYKELKSEKDQTA